MLSDITRVIKVIKCCPYLGIGNLKISIISLCVCFRFNPPGLMSAGLTCELSVTFKPMVSLNSIRVDVTLGQPWPCLDLLPSLPLLFGIAFHLQLVLLSYHPIFLRPYHFL